MCSYSFLERPPQQKHLSINQIRYQQPFKIPGPTLISSRINHTAPASLGRYHPRSAGVGGPAAAGTVDIALARPADKPLPALLCALSLVFTCLDISAILCLITLSAGLSSDARVMSARAVSQSSSMAAAHPRLYSACHVRRPERRMHQSPTQRPGSACVYLTMVWSYHQHSVAQPPRLQTTESTHQDHLPRPPTPVHSKPSHWTHTESTGKHRATCMMADPVLVL